MSLLQFFSHAMMVSNHTVPIGRFLNSLPVLSIFIFSSVNSNSNAFSNVMYCLVG